MFTTIALAIAAIAGGISVYNNWPEIKTWLSDFVRALAKLFSTVFEGVAHATAVFIRVVKKGGSRNHTPHLRSNGRNRRLRGNHNEESNRHTCMGAGRN